MTEAEYGAQKQQRAQSVSGFHCILVGLTTLVKSSGHIITSCRYGFQAFVYVRSRLNFLPPNPYFIKTSLALSIRPADSIHPFPDCFPPHLPILFSTPISVL